MKDLYWTYIETRRVTGESTDVPFDAFKTSLEKHQSLLKEKFGDQYEIKVVIEDGKTKVKGAGKKK